MLAAGQGSRYRYPRTTQVELLKPADGYGLEMFEVMYVPPAGQADEMVCMKPGIWIWLDFAAGYF